ncbi:MAG TPA: hypothetical protein VMD74_01030 [Candidatus Methylomirabilis sp.]|nr:hypothetical protein [Candidatus Methylomirabilis sp.]
MKKLKCDYCDYTATGSGEDETMDVMMDHYMMFHKEKIMNMSEAESLAMMKKTREKMIDFS